MKDHYLDERAKRVTDDACMNLIFKLITLKRAAKNEDEIHEKSVNNLCPKLSKLSDVSTGSA